ncbi:hypothetical protein [Baekduia sp. Peel2402]|uniref:hypothetical protein n=1 Tax=Baekduia sp. Peel2402 TaxID=3458296 RepID=UPI00403EEFEA
MSADVTRGPSPVVLDVPGDWWDAYLYSGRLYLITIDGDVVVVDWPTLVESLVDRREDRLGLELAFVDARFLYGDDWARLVRDPEIGQLLTDKINRLAASDLEVTPDQFERAVVGRYRRGVPEAISDLEIHRSRIYTASETGLGMVDRNRLSGGTVRQWDGEAVRLRASGAGMLAVAAGSDGLRQARLRSWAERLEEPQEVLRGDFAACSWLRTSIYASSHVHAGALAVFSQTKREDATRGRQTIRTFEAALDDEALFDEEGRNELDRLVRASWSPTPEPASLDVDPAPSETADAGDAGLRIESRYDAPPLINGVRHGFSWAGQGLVCRAFHRQLEIVRYDGRADLLSKRLRNVGIENLETDAAVTDGDVAPFGIVVETDDDLKVITNDGVQSIGVEPVRWRTYHRATNYPNQLHVIGEDRLRVVSFLNEDMRKFAAGRSAPIGRTRRSQ